MEGLPLLGNSSEARAIQASVTCSRKGVWRHPSPVIAPPWRSQTPAIVDRTSPPLSPLTPLWDWPAPAFQPGICQARNHCAGSEAPGQANLNGSLRRRCRSGRAGGGGPVGGGPRRRHRKRSFLEDAAAALWLAAAGPPLSLLGDRGAPNPDPAPRRVRDPGSTAPSWTVGRPGMEHRQHDVDFSNRSCQTLAGQGASSANLTFDSGARVGRPPHGLSDCLVLSASGLRVFSRVR